MNGRLDSTRRSSCSRCVADSTSCTCLYSRQGFSCTGAKAEGRRRGSAAARRWRGGRGGRRQQQRQAGRQAGGARHAPAPPRGSPRASATGQRRASCAARAPPASSAAGERWPSRTRPSRPPRRGMSSLRSADGWWGGAAAAARQREGRGGSRGGSAEARAKPQAVGQSDAPSFDNREPILPAYQLVKPFTRKDMASGRQLRRRRAILRTTSTIFFCQKKLLRFPQKAAHSLPPSISINAQRRDVAGVL